MAKNASVVRAVFRGLAKMQANYLIEIGPVRARGIPAILVGVGGILIGAGVARVLSRSSERLPETLREARGLAETLRGDMRRLNP